MSTNRFHVRTTLTCGHLSYEFYSLKKLIKTGLPDVTALPYSLKVLLENLLRYEDGVAVLKEDVESLANWAVSPSSREIAFRPARVLMQDFTGVPAVVDLAAMREAMKLLGQDPKKINPQSTVDLVIDHSVQVDKFASPEAYRFNVELEMERNAERYQFLRWGQQSFENFRVVPPGTGICHQVNLEKLAQCVWTKKIRGNMFAFPDTVVGTDSHTTMVNALGVLGWGVGGIEAEAAMLGQPISMLIPEVIGFKFTGKLREGITATDLVLTVTQMLRQKGVVGKFVEFFGSGLDALSLADRATIANMAPEYGATCGFFPIDEITLDYLRSTGRSQETLSLVEAYCKEQGLWRDESTEDPIFTDTESLDLSTVEASLAGPKRPQDKVVLSEIANATANEFQAEKVDVNKKMPIDEGLTLTHGDVVIAAITSCTNTSNPSVLMAAGLMARNAVEKGLSCKPWVKTSLAPGSKVVSEYLSITGLQTYLDTLGFNLVGYGCTTCIGNSGPLREDIEKAVTGGDLHVASVLSGNRNFEGRVHPLVKANWLASPPLVVAFALAGTTLINLTKDSLGSDKDGNPVYLKDIWPSNFEIAYEVEKITAQMYEEQYAEVFEGDSDWKALPVTESLTYEWNPTSTYVQHPPFFKGISACPVPVKDITEARVLALLGDSITTDHISPAGAIKSNSPAGAYLKEKGVAIKDFNSYGSRRGNHEVMMRGTLSNIRLRNEMLEGVEGGMTRHIPSNEELSIFDAAMLYQKEETPLVIIAGKEYGTGSSRDWAAKGTTLLGVQAVIAESFERIHRSNLIGMGVLPLQFLSGENRKTLGLTGDEIISIKGIADKLMPSKKLGATITFPSGETKEITLLCRIDTENELAYFQHGGILQYVMRSQK
jgi:aconitate hydratase